VESTTCFWSKATPGSGVGAVGGRDLDLAGPGDAALALHPVDLVLLEQELDALGQLADAVVLGLVHLGQVQLGLDVDADAGEALVRLFEQLGGVQQRLGRHAADVQAGAAEGGAHLHAGDLQAELTGADRGVVAAGSAADDHNVVEAVLRHAGYFLNLRGVEKRGHTSRARRRVN
jgi:hypothetical protein